METIVIIALASGTVLSLGAWVLRHTANGGVHVSEQNGYVSQSTCDAKHEAVLRELTGLHKDVGKIITMLTERN